MVKNYKQKLKIVEDQCYAVWIASKEGAILPRWLDFDFKAAFKDFIKRINEQNRFEEMWQQMIELNS